MLGVRGHARKLLCVLVGEGVALLSLPLIVSIGD